MIKSALQIARAEYQPKLPKALLGAVKACEGAPTQSVSDQEEIKKLFPNACCSFRGRRGSQGRAN